MLCHTAKKSRYLPPLEYTTHAIWNLSTDCRRGHRACGRLRFCGADGAVAVAAGSGFRRHPCAFRQRAAADAGLQRLCARGGTCHGAECKLGAGGELSGGRHRPRGRGGRREDRLWQRRRAQCAGRIRQGGGVHAAGALPAAGRERGRAQRGDHRHRAAEFARFEHYHQRRRRHGAGAGDRSSARAAAGRSVPYDGGRRNAGEHHHLRRMDRARACRGHASRCAR